MQLETVRERPKLSSLAYAPLKYDLGDTDAMAAEILRYRNKMGESLVQKRWLQATDLSDFPKLASEEDFAMVDYADGDAKKTIRVPGGRSTFLALNFTKSEAEKDSRHFSLNKRAQMLKSSWSWNEEFPIPKTAAMIEDLLRPRKLLLCRALITRAGSFVPWHRDGGGETIRASGYLHVNFILSSGGSPLMIKIGDKYVEVWDKAFIFNDGNYHGVPKVTGDRVVLSVAAQMDESRIRQILDWGLARV